MIRLPAALWKAGLLMKMRSFRDLQVWQRAMGLAADVYTATGSFPKAEVFGMTSQLRRAAVSVPSNIAEGQGRLTDKHFLLFLTQARGSLFEMETQLELAGRIGFLSNEVSGKLMKECEEVARMLNGLIGTLRNI